VEYDVIVVGAGPAGCATARLVAQAGYRVLVLEEHPAAGEPVRCAGLVSPRTLEVAGVGSDVVVSAVTGARIHGPLGAVLSVDGGRVYALAVDRAAFDRRLAGAAAGAGAEMVYSARVTDLEYVRGGVRVRWRQGRAPGEATARLLVGADGPRSLVARWCGLPPPPAVVRMWAAEVELPHAGEGTVELFLGRRVAPGWFGWLIPVGPSRARVGTGTVNGKAPGACFRHLAARYPGVFGAMRVLRTTGGVVPLGLRPKCYGERVLVVGDAAGQVKPISGGGLYPGLLGARLCARVACESLARGDCSVARLSRYQRLLEEQMGREFRLALRHREVYLRLTDREVDEILRFLNRPYWRRVVAAWGDTDYPSVLAGRLLAAGPWAARFWRACEQKTLPGRGGNSRRVENFLREDRCGRRERLG